MEKRIKPIMRLEVPFYETEDIVIYFRDFIKAYAKVDKAGAIFMLERFLKLVKEHGTEDK